MLLIQHLLLVRKQLYDHVISLSVPRVAPVVPEVPKDNITATTVMLSWEPIDPRDVNALPEEFRYLVSIRALGLVSSESGGMTRRQTGDLAFDRCLMAAGIDPTINKTVPGNTTSLMLSGIGERDTYHVQY